MRFDLDFNLLKTLLVLAEKQNLKKAGITLGLTESAVSKQLTRLREQLNDELFIRMSGKLEPTSYAQSIIPKVKVAIGDLEEAVEPATFEPSTYSDPIHITLPDLVIERFGITLYEKLLQKFPSTSVTLHSWGDETENKIVSGQIDFGVHLLNPERSSGVYQQHICDDALIIASAAHHSEYHWDEVKHWPFIKQRAIGWNEQKFQFIEHLHNNGIDLNYAHEIDSASFALKIMTSRKVANVLPSKVLGKEFMQVAGTEFINFDIIWASNTRTTDRKSPLYQCLHLLFSQMFIER
ncbi:LysR family transcriptional regulator [Vibrio natriegens]|uniref:LysR family transcriptional regulator n=1 Tax=Vibrio natriegens TaxID=691 RepID=UPI003DA01F99